MVEVSAVCASNREDCGVSLSLGSNEGDKAALAQALVGRGVVRGEGTGSLQHAVPQSVRHTSIVTRRGALQFVFNNF